MSNRYALRVTGLSVALYPVSFVLESRRARFVSLGDPDGAPLARPVHSQPDDTARGLLEDTINELVAHVPAETPAGSISQFRDLVGHSLSLVGAACIEDRVELIYTSPIPTPFAEEYVDISTGSPYAWTTVNQSRGGSTRDRPRIRSGSDAIVLDHWRQAFEETDIALDFLPDAFNLLQLRGLYDAIWGYDQDPSGFKRWAIDRRGAFRELLQELPAGDPRATADPFYASLGEHLSPAQAARAGATVGHTSGSVDPDLSLPIGVAAATTINRLHPRRGPEPTWYLKAATWRQGPTWLENLYPPRPNWTRWGLGPERRTED